MPIFNISQISVLPVSVVQACKATCTDRVLSKVHYLTSGWPVKVPVTLKLYFTRHDKLSIEEGSILLGIKFTTVVPKKLESYLCLSYEVHVGMVNSSQLYDYDDYA